MKRLIYILVAFTALLTAACSQTIVFDEINEVVPPVSTTIQDNQIWYTTNSGGTVSPQNMPSVESNIYVNGKGIITFSQKLTAIETRAFEKCENLVTITLPDCIENIAAEAFNECNSLTKINIPKSTSEIGQEAFCKCLSLKSITIPSSVDAIGYCAFEGCHNLATLTFEGGSDASNLTSIDGGAFNNCSALKSLVLPSSLRTLGESAFSNCTSLTTVTLPDDLEFVDGAVFSGCSALKEFKGNNVSADGRCLIHNGVMKGFAPANLTSYTLPDSIEGLCNHLFEDFTTITSITLPSSLRNIGEWCFSGCNGLTSITIPERVDNIEAYAFYSCEKLAAVYAKPTDPPALSTEVFGGSRPSTFKIYVAAKNIEIYKSSWSVYKSYIVVDKNSDPIATDWSIAGSHCDWDIDQGTQMTISGEYAVANGVTFVSDSEFKFVANKNWDVNYGVAPGTTIKLGETYQGKASADNIKIAAGTYNIKLSIYDATFTIEKGSVNPNAIITYTSTDGNIVTPYQLDAFGVNIISNTYNNDQGQIIFDGEVKAVGYDAFNGCTTLASIALPEGVTEIGYRAFRGCSELTGVTLPNSITTFADHVFNACGKLQSIALPKSLKKIGNYAFNNCNSLEFVHVLDMADWCNITFSNNTSTPLYYAKKLYCNGKEVTEANIPEGITAISDYAFYNCVPLTKVTIPASVTSIGGYAFTNCSNIKYVYCKPTTPPTIGSQVFMHIADGSYHYTNCTIYVPEGSVTAYISAAGWVDYADRIMSEYSANNVIRYTSTDGKVVTPYSADVFGVTIVSNSYTDGQGVIVLSDNPTKIGAFAFRDCKTLATISIPTTVQEIGNSAFNNCQGLENLTIPTSVTSIGTQAFYCCNSISSVTIPQSVTTISDNAFGFCASLAEFKGKFASEDGRCLVVNGTLNSFASAGVTEYTIPSSVTAIGHYAMHNSALLTTVTIPQSVQTVGDGAFNGCISLASVYCKPTTPPTGGSAMFDNNAANRKIYVPAGSVDAYKTAAGWSNYADAIFADADPANCQILYTSTDGNVVTPNKADVFGTTIVSNTYENGQGVITFDSAVTSVGNYAFYKCRNLTSVTIPNGVTLIGNNAFDECSISSIIIPDGVESIGTDAFICCHNLTEVHIPQNVINLGGNPFRSCNGLAKFSGKYASADGRLLVQNGNIYSFAQAGLVEYTITEPGVNTIGWELFRDCESLVEVTIPQTITKIDFEAFYNCSSLKSVYCRSATPPTGEVGMFDNNAANRKIYVPASSVEAYKSAQYWSDYADAIVAEGGDGILPTFESNEIVGHNVPFAVGDLFYVFNKINHCDEYKYNGNTNEEGKPIIELSNPTYYSSHKTIDKVIIVYNSDKSLSLPVNEGSATSVNVVVKSVQDYVRGSYDIHAAPMISVSDDLGSVLLKNVCGWVKVSLTGNGETVKKIEFSGNNNEELATSSMISSSATISLSDLSVTSVGYAFTKLTMDFDNADEDENWDTATLSTTPTDFYFSMLPTEFTNGFNMKITCTDGTMMTYTTNNSISVSRNEVYQETPFTYAGEPIQLNISDLNSPVFRDLTYSEGYANTFEVKVANNKYQNGFFIFYNPDYQPSGAGDAGTLNGEYEIVTDEIGTKTYTAKTFIADPSRSCVPYDGDLYYFKSGKVTVSGNNASTTIAFDAIVTNSEGSELPLKSQCTLESMGYTTLTNAENLGFSSFVYQASGGYFTMQSTSGQNTMTIELKTTAKTPNELKDKTFTDTALTDYISSGSLRMGDLTSYDTLVGSIIFAVEGLNYTMTTKGLKFIDYTGNIYQIPDGGYSVSLKQGTINSGGGIW